MKINYTPLASKQFSRLDKPYTKESAKEYIKELLAVQTGKLSDQKIADMLYEKYGISIARRTVAKYRKELNIAASYDR